MGPLPDDAGLYQCDVEGDPRRLSELFELMPEEMQKSTGQSGLPPRFAVALTKIDGSVAMKKLGQELRCDPSFVTAIAGLEERGPRSPRAGSFGPASQESGSDVEGDRPSFETAARSLR
jgi:hypothetical protein